MDKSQRIYLFFKRLIAILGSLIGILFCLVLFWWWIFIVNLIVTKGHPIFVQERIGKDKRVFKIIKFRSMKNDANHYLPPSDMNDDIQREMETKFGHFLRRSQLDETLQLLNIFVGQMAFIGPRPGAAKNEERLIEEREAISPGIYSLRPGLTGLAQNELIEDKHNPKLKAEKDYEYLKNISFWLDIKIFCKTIVKCFKK